jgi:formamidopyrimidine-DNA glycosylase
MPELPEVEAVRRQLRPVMVGARLARVHAARPDLRFPFAADFIQRLTGQTIHALRRRGKYLLADLSSGDVLLMHLGMSGSFRVESPARNRPGPAFRYPRGAAGLHDHVTFHLSSGHLVIFNDPRRFGFMRVIPDSDEASDPSLRLLGPEPLAAPFDGETLAAALRGRRTSLKAALSDQRVVAGLGNIYVSEALHRGGLSPRRRASTLATASGAPRPAAHALARAIRAVLQEAVRWQSRRDRRDRFRVYDREGLRCLKRECSGRIRRIVQGGRATFYCPVCQK